MTTGQHPAVAAVLAVTPTIDKVHGQTVTDFEGNPYSAEPIAARQASAVLRWAAAWLDVHAGLAHDPQSVRNAADALLMDAEQIEAGP